MQWKFLVSSPMHERAKLRTISYIFHFVNTLQLPAVLSGGKWVSLELQG